MPITINTRSSYLTVLIATYNRLEALKVAINAIHAQTKCSHEIIVIDGGSTDGTIEYLQSRNDITPIFQGKLLGASRAYNEAWRRVDSQYTCWLSDDTELTSHGLDMAVRLLEDDPEIGMVGLKTKDVIGPRVSLPYIGAVSEYGILNCNHGVLPTDTLRSVGYFNEDYPSYLIDPDLTASILCTGKNVVMTKSVCILHHREWIAQSPQASIAARMKGIDHGLIYRKKFAFLSRLSISEKIRRRMGFLLYSKWMEKFVSNLFGLNARDWQNLRKGRFISFLDPLKNKSKLYHNEQHISRNILLRDGNIYKHLLK